MVIYKHEAHQNKLLLEGYPDCKAPNDPYMPFHRKNYAKLHQWTYETLNSLAMATWRCEKKLFQT